MSLVTPRDNIAYLPHQETGVRWMLSREEETAVVCRGGILADDMGLGKTFQTIGLLKNTPFALRTLIICPSALIAGWTSELEACGYGVAVLEKSTWTSDDVSPNTVCLTTYSKAGLYRRMLAMSDPPFERVILDEGHVIRNRKTARWLSCMNIAFRAKCRWILSATPVQNGASDWVSLCYWLRVRGVSDEVIMELSPTLMLRRTMDDLRGVLDTLPPVPCFVNREFHIAEGTEEGQMFRRLCNTAIENESASALIKLELWMRIQQFLVHPQLYLDAVGYTGPEWTGGTTKWSACMSDLEEAVRMKEGVIVFCNFRAEMDRVAAAAEEMGAEVCVIRGSSVEIGEAVRRGREAVADGKAVVMVVQIVSGGAGLNLQFCRRILFLSRHWNPAVVHQAVGRAVRIGQTAVVRVVFYSVVDDVDDNIDMEMWAKHSVKIAGAQDICETLFQGYYSRPGLL
jgi:SNF2 family DNA or RNA helicase